MKTWSIGNGLTLTTDPGHSLHQITPSSFDPDGFMRDDRAYRFDQIKHRFIFRRKRDWLEAVEELRKRGYRI